MKDNGFFVRDHVPIHGGMRTELRVSDMIKIVPSAERHFLTTDPAVSIVQINADIELSGKRKRGGLRGVPGLNKPFGQKEDWRFRDLRTTYVGYVKPLLKRVFTFIIQSVAMIVVAIQRMLSQYIRGVITNSTKLPYVPMEIVGGYQERYSSY